MRSEDFRELGFYYERGLEYMGSGKFDLAIADFDQVIAIDPNSADAYNNRGRAYAITGEHDKAIADCEKAIALNPHLDSAYNVLGGICSEKGNNDQAIAYLDRAIALNPQNYKAYYNRGKAYRSKEMHDRAVADYDRAIAINPQDDKAYNNRGNVYFAKKMYSQAIDDFNQAIAINPNNAMAHRNRDNAYAAQKIYDITSAAGDRTGGGKSCEQYNYARNFSEGLAAVKKDDLWGFIDKKGREVVPTIYEEVGDFHEGLARVKTEDLWGFIDQKGNEIISVQYDLVQDFSEGYAIACGDGDFWFIDPEGNEYTIPRMIDKIASYSEGLAPVLSGSEWGYMDINREIIIWPQYEDAGNFHEGLARVKKEGISRYVDKNGKELVLPQYRRVGDFSEGLAKVNKDFNWGYIDRTGKEIIPPNEEYYEAYEFSHRLACVINDEDKAGFINRSGELVIPFQYGATGMFREGFFAARHGGKCGYIDTAGKVAIPFKFDMTDDFYDGMARVLINGTWNFIDKTGEIVIRGGKCDRLDDENESRQPSDEIDNDWEDEEDWDDDSVDDEEEDKEDEGKGEKESAILTRAKESIRAVRSRAGESGILAEMLASFNTESIVARRDDLRFMSECGEIIHLNTQPFRWHEQKAMDNLLDEISAQMVEMFYVMEVQDKDMHYILSMLQFMCESGAKAMRRLNEIHPDMRIEDESDIPEEIIRMRSRIMDTFKDMMDELDPDKFGSREKIALVTVVSSCAEKLMEMIGVMELNNEEIHVVFEMIGFLCSEAVNEMRRTDEDFVAGMGMDDWVDVACPVCHEKVTFEARILDEDNPVEVTCPYCGGVVYDNTL